MFRRLSQLLRWALGGALLSCGGDASGPPPPISVTPPPISVTPPAVSSVSLAPASLLLGVGRSVPINVQRFDSHGVLLEARPTTFTSSANAVVTVSPEGLLTGQSAGPATISVSCEGIVATLPVIVTATTAVNIVADIINPFQDKVATDLVAALRGEGDSLASAPLGSGSQLTVAGSIGLPPVVDIVVGSSSNQLTLPSLGRFPMDQLPTSVTVITIPASSSVTSGKWANVSSELSMVRAFTPVCNTLNLNCSGFFRSDFRYGVKAWAPSAFPIPVMIDRGRSPAPISDADSVAIWSGLHDMEQAFGRTLFAPAPFDPALSFPGYGAISVAVDGSITGAGEAGWGENEDHEIVEAHITFKDARAIADKALIAHEFMHALGFGHTCQWPSVMGVGGQGCARVEITATDVVYANVARLVHDTEYILRAGAELLPSNLLSLGAAADGEALRKPRLGLSWVSANVQSPPVRRTDRDSPFTSLHLPGFAGGSWAY